MQIKNGILACAEHQIKIVVDDIINNYDFSLTLTPTQCRIRKINLGSLASPFSSIIEVKSVDNIFFLAAKKGAHASKKETRKLYRALTSIFPQDQDLKFRYFWEAPTLLIFFLLIVASAAFACYRVYETVHDHIPSGPILVKRVSSDHLLSLNPTTLFVFDERGNLKEKLHDSYADFRAAAAKSHGHYYLMDRRANTLWQYRNIQCSSYPVAASPPFEGRIFLAVSPDGQYLITIEKDKDRIRVYSYDGQQQQMLARSDHRFCFPGNGTFGQDGRFYLTDTNLNRIVAFDFHSGRLHKREEHLMALWQPKDAGTECVDEKIPRFLVRISLRREIAIPFLDVRDGHVWPIDVAQLDDGRWAVLLAHRGTQESDIVLFNEDWTQPAPLTVPEKSNITAIAPWSDGLVAADLRTPGLWHIVDQKFVPWQDTTFQQWMQSTEQRYQKYQQQGERLPWIIVFIVVLFSAIYFLTNRIKIKRLSEHCKSQRENHSVR